MFSIVFLIVTCLTYGYGYEDVTCSKNGVPGICTNILQCRTALNDIKNKKAPQVCSVEQATVCCFDHLNSVAQHIAPPESVATSENNSVAQHTAPPESVATTEKNSRSFSTTTEYTPETYDYVDMEHAGQCEPIPTSLTSPTTGQKAWDKCIEYQERLVFPCERGVAMVGEPSRSNNCHHNADVLIVGGRIASDHEFPHMVMLGYGEQWNYLQLQWLCGGSLISERFVLTAGHCTSDPRVGSVTNVLVGALRRSEVADRSKIYEVNRIITHPKYKHYSKYNDIALLETKKEMKLSQFVVPACLHVGDAVDDSRASATGWGLTSFGGSASEELQKVILSKFETRECEVKFPKEKIKMEFGFTAHTQMCYGDRNNSRDTCQGDSGGPLQILCKKIKCMYVVIGVTSFGRACGFAGEPAVYTRVAPYVPWIESVVWP